jgi:hypothetical protein
MEEPIALSFFVSLGFLALDVNNIVSQKNNFRKFANFFKFLQF